MFHIMSRSLTNSGRASTSTYLRWLAEFLSTPRSSFTRGDAVQAPREMPELLAPSIAEGHAKPAEKDPSLVLWAVLGLLTLGALVVCPLVLACLGDAFGVRYMMHLATVLAVLVGVGAVAGIAHLLFSR